MNYIQILYLCILKQPTSSAIGSSSCCELHSNLVSLHSETTPFCWFSYNRKLWITFKSCIFAFWNNCNFRILLRGKVVNYIQILYLCILKQLTGAKPKHIACCELHSNLVSLHSETTSQWWTINRTLLWITFKSCIFAFWNNNFLLSKLSTTVVNYIQILYLCILKQLVPKIEHTALVVNYIQILYLCILKQLKG